MWENKKCSKPPSSIDMDDLWMIIPNTRKNTSHVPNHQPAVDAAKTWDIPRRNFGFSCVDMVGAIPFDPPALHDIL